MCRFVVLSLFPEMVRDAALTSIFKRGVEADLLGLECLDIRGFSKDKHRRVDDYPYGGGAGMVMQAQPIYDAYVSALSLFDVPPKVVYLSPAGRRFNQRIASEYAEHGSIMFIAGRYEGIDQRVIEEIVTDEISIGDYVLTGGELAALVVMDAVARLVPGVLGAADSLSSESFQHNSLEYPQYTRPEVVFGKSVPEVLLSGDHGRIAQWRKKMSLERTIERRPDLIKD